MGQIIAILVLKVGISFTLAIYTTNRGHGRGGTHPTPRRERTSPPSLFFFASFFFSLKKSPKKNFLSLTSRQQPQISSLKPAGIMGAPTKARSFLSINPKPLLQSSNLSSLSSHSLYRHMTSQPQTTQPGIHSSFIGS